MQSQVRIEALAPTTIPNAPHRLLGVLLSTRGGGIGVRGVAYFGSSRSPPQVLTEPKGVVLAVVPWNFPFVLSLKSILYPLAAGNCVL